MQGGFKIEKPYRQRIHLYTIIVIKVDGILPGDLALLRSGKVENYIKEEKSCLAFFSVSKFLQSSKRKPTYDPWTGV